MSKTFDPECYNLACYFLDECKGVTEKKREDLARRIQQTIDDYEQELMDEETIRQDCEWQVLKDYR